MKITKRDGFAILPVRCDKCNTLFWMEFYDKYDRSIVRGVRLWSTSCKRCRDKRAKHEIEVSATTPDILSVLLARNITRLEERGALNVETSHRYCGTDSEGVRMHYGFIKYEEKI